MTHQKPKTCRNKMYCYALTDEFSKMIKCDCFNANEKYCYAHNDFDIHFHCGNIEEQSDFDELVLSLSSFESLKTYIDASLYYSCLLDAKRFYQNAVSLVTA